MARSERDWRPEHLQPLVDPRDRDRQSHEPHDGGALLRWVSLQCRGVGRTPRSEPRNDLRRAGDLGFHGPLKPPNKLLLMRSEPQILTMAHRSIKMLREYVQQGNVLVENAARYLDL